MIQFLNNFLIYLEIGISDWTIKANAENYVLCLDSNSKQGRNHVLNTYIYVPLSLSLSEHLDPLLAFEFPSGLVVDFLLTVSKVPGCNLPWYRLFPPLKSKMFINYFKSRAGTRLYAFCFVISLEKIEYRQRH